MPHRPGGVARLAPIIVTARKRDERAPVAAPALSQEQLQRYSTVTLISFSQQVPQLGTWLYDIAIAVRRLVMIPHPT